MLIYATFEVARWRQGDVPDFNVFHFSFLDDTLPDWEKEIELSDTELIFCAEAQVRCEFDSD